MKDIPGYEGLYKIDECGNVYSFHISNRHTTKNNTLSQWKNTSGYCYVRLSKNKEHKAFPVHRLVAMTYISIPNEKLDINHIDGDKTNNNVSNLEWCTHKENMQHAHNNKLIDMRRNSPGEWWNWTEEQLQAHEATLNKVAFVI